MDSSSPPKPTTTTTTTNNPINPTTEETHTLTPTSPITRPKPKRKPNNNTRKPRKRSTKETPIKEDLDDDHDHLRKPKKRKHQHSKQPMSPNGDMLPLVASIPSSSPGLSDGSGSGESCDVWELIWELVMWKDVAKSALCFGSGSILFMSSVFSRGSSFSIIPATSHLGILILGVAFFNDCLPQREQQKSKEVKLQLTEEDFLRAARLILPMTNAVLSKSQKFFSGEPSMTLKVAPVLLLTSKFGHLITPWRLLAIGFFSSFTIPKLYSSYSEKIHQQVEKVNSCVKEAWESCPRKKFVATSAAMVLWNMCSVKMRMFAAFMSVVVLRHRHQQHRGAVSCETERVGEQQQVMMVED